MKIFDWKLRLVAPLVVMCCLISAGSQVVQAQIYSSDPNIADFTEISSYATLSNFNNFTCGADSSCPSSPSFMPTSVELATYGYRVYNLSPSTAVTGLDTGNNWILASFSSPVSTIVVFPNIDHFGSSYDGYQYQIYGSNDGSTWTKLFDATSVIGAVEPFTLGTFTGTAPSSVNNVLTPQSVGLQAGCSGVPTPCAVGYIAQFKFGTAYQYYAFGASTVAINSGNVEQELSAVGTPPATRIGTLPPTSGALLTINGTVGATLVNRTIYDSQIHTGNLRQVPMGSGGSNCNANDQTFPTDAYVLQGGSWTGCDPGNPFELGQGPGNATVTGAGYSFTVTTSYTSGPQCNTHNTICVGEAPATLPVGASNGVDTGFLTIKNTSGADFSVGIGQTGITLSGTPVNLTGTNAAFCPPSGGASDTITTLAAGASAVLALSTDSSDCGGFNQSQTKPLTAGQTTIFPIGGDDYQINPFNSAQFDFLTLLPVPVPAGPLGSATFTSFLLGQYGTEAPSFPTSPFSATNFPGQACIAISDLSAPGNPVCLNYQLSCFNNGTSVNNGSGSTCADALTFLYTAQIDFTKDTNSLGTIGGTAFLGQHDGSPVGYLGQCPTNGFNINSFLAYTATAPDPITSSTKGNSCFVGTFDPTAAPVPVGSALTQKTFVGFQSPVTDFAPLSTINSIKKGSTVPLIWQTFSDSAGTQPVTNLTLCTDPTGATCSTNPPSVFVGIIPTSCGTDDPIVTDSISSTMTSGSSGLQNFLNGTYQYNLQTTNIPVPVGGCFTPVLEFSGGFVALGYAEFKFH